MSASNKVWDPFSSDVARFSSNVDTEKYIEKYHGVSKINERSEFSLERTQVSYIAIVGMTDSGFLWPFDYPKNVECQIETDGVVRVLSEHSFKAAISDESVKEFLKRESWDGIIFSGDKKVVFMKNVFSDGISVFYSDFDLTAATENLFLLNEQARSCLVTPYMFR